MVLKNYEDLTALAKKLPKPGIVAVAGAADAHTIDAVLMARDEGVAEPFLVGDPQIIKEILRRCGRNPADFRISGAFSGMDEAETAVELIKTGEAAFLMKGMMETSEVLRPVVRKENGLRTDRGMSHVGFNSVPGLQKLICITDGAMVPSPDLNQKKNILLNALDVFRKLGYENPKAACVCCKETYDAKIPATVDARALRDAALCGELGACFVEGPISYDIAMSAHIAEMKGFSCPHCGDFDIILVPDIHSGNILTKSLLMHCASQMAGIVVGARAPIVLTSRGSSAEEKLFSLVLASVVTAGE